MSNSNDTTTVTEEASDSNSSSYPFHAKRPRHDSNASSSRFKGVVCQPNGHWGAQIYANHQRIWLGTFISEKEAAMAYDSAAIKIRSGDSHRNFPWTNITALEPNFQSQFTTEEILTMIKEGFYPSKFADYLKVKFQMGEVEISPNSEPVHCNGDYLCRKLFQKELTHSDVSKLNRLVIPKKNAVKYFPRISDGAEENEAGGEGSDTLLVFYDRSMRSWKFRYCYWKSSQSFVFTKGWNKFVKDKELKAKDTVIFSLCECRDGTNELRSFCMIDVRYCDQVENNGGVVQEEKALQLELGENVDGDCKEEFEQAAKQLYLVQKINDTEEERELVGAKSIEEQKKGLWLFGVQIS